MEFSRSIDEVVETLQNAKARNRGCSLLIGAGASVTAGIPTANGFVEIISERYPYKFNQVSDPKTYPKCMANLLRDERRGLISEFVDAAKINWAHVCVALLIQHGYVDRVLTTNFDPLVTRACALLGEFPAIYDFAASQSFIPANIPDQAVFHLHGQRTGFVLLNTKNEVERLSKALRPVFEDAGQGRTWLVVGYSGDCDPVFDHLARVAVFENGLYWVCYKDHPPAKHVEEKLLVSGKDAFFVPKFDADSFFVTLCQKLQIFPPKLIARPFTYMDGILKMLTPYQTPGQPEAGDVTFGAREWISMAIVQYEDKIADASQRAREGGSPEDEVPDAVVAAATEFVMAGNFESALSFSDAYQRKPMPALGEMLAWAYVMKADALLDSASGKSGNLVKEIDDVYTSALKLKPDMHEALNHWGNALLDQAKTKTGEEADRLFTLAGEKYEAALAIKPDKHEALYNWGNALLAEAETKTGEEADRLLAEAGEKYEAALAIKPDKLEALNNWGNALLAQARTKTGEEAERLLALAGGKYEAALAINADDHEVLNNWAEALSEQAKTKTGEEADRLFALAGEKYEAALAIKPNDLDALNNWGAALLAQAHTKAGEEADRLSALAQEKFAAAKAIKAGQPE